MPQVVIENPILNSPYAEPRRRFRFGDDGVTEVWKDKSGTTATAWMLWVPVINNHGGYGRWAFVEITDPWDAMEMAWEIMNREGGFFNGYRCDNTGKNKKRLKSLLQEGTRNEFSR
jgi:hypothetical protein